MIFNTKTSFKKVNTRLFHLFFRREFFFSEQENELFWIFGEQVLSIFMYNCTFAMPNWKKLKYFYFSKIDLATACLSSTAVFVLLRWFVMVLHLKFSYLADNIKYLSSINKLQDIFSLVLLLSFNFFFLDFFPTIFLILFFPGKKCTIRAG